MTFILQNILALALVAACGSWALWQGVKSLSGKRSKLGSCCDKGCGAGEKVPGGEKVSGGASVPAGQKTQTAKVHFLPSDMLRRR